ncbi:hypothetical protein BH11PSE6_BH11PSE6_13310 [soil metagenome]
MRVFLRLFRPAIALALPFFPVAAQAQMVQQLNPLGDELAAEMRMLAANPLDINALVRAGELALKLGDSTAAATFFARAERLDPRNARIKAGMGSLLVQAERPGEARRRFGEAEGLGLDPRAYAADRGLAYDLIGQQERAQRDYRLALQDGSADETVRRYALSLGISGKRDPALQQLDPLLRKNDRGAWRARAFILAMNGDDKGAERIATNMMPPGLAQGLQPFFERLPTLAPTDRAFAVHFGELRATPERIADARLIPTLAPLPPEPGAGPVAVAAVQAAPARKEDRRSRRKQRGRKYDIQVAATPPPAPQPEPLPPPPVYVASTEVVQPLPVTPSRAPEPSRQTMTLRPAPERPRAVAARPKESTPVVAAAPAQGAAVQASANRPVASSPATVGTALQAPSRVAAAEPVPNGPTSPASSGSSVPSATQASGTMPPSSLPVASPVTLGAATPAGTASASPPANTGESAPTDARVVADVTPPPAAPPPAAPVPVRSEDSILASIIANIAVPGSELDVAPVEPVRTEPAAPAPVRIAPQPAEPAAAVREAAARKALEDKKALADKRAAEARKLAEAKKVAEAKKAAELKKKNDPKLLEPSRIWVQVAGGANEGSLPKEWEKVRAKAPVAFKGKSGWTTPLRATNRVLAGPFKTNDEARSFVNALAKEGISAFTFTSDAGQKIAKLAIK